jgi:hypothetical protein
VDQHVDPGIESTPDKLEPAESTTAFEPADPDAMDEIEPEERP